jgi:hypothetical protein
MGGQHRSIDDHRFDALERADAAIAEGWNAIQGLRDSNVETNDLALALPV